MSLRAKAILGLILTCCLWGISFPAFKSLAMLQAARLPHENSLFFASADLTWRFIVSALILLPYVFKKLHRITWSEIKFGSVLGLITGMTYGAQADGMQYTQASTSAFLTQSSCILIPVMVTIHHWKWPTKPVFISCMMAIIGVGVLAGIDLRHFTIGRGEWETLLCACIATASILWIERKEFQYTDRILGTWIMCVFAVLSTLPFAWFFIKDPATSLIIPPLNEWVLILILSLLSTVFANSLMNSLQHHITSTEAGLIYTLEPVFTSLFALFLPMWASRWCGVAYPNETVTYQLLIGGGLVFAANILIILKGGI